MRIKAIAAAFILLSMCLSFVPLPALATGQFNVNGVMDPNESYSHWFLDQTWEFAGYRNHQEHGAAIGFDAYYSSDSSNLYLFISTNDSTVSPCNRDKFSIYFDIYPYGRGSEDIAYQIEPPTSLYGGGVKMHGPNWCNIELYASIASSSNASGFRTYEVRIPFSDIVPNASNSNYRYPKFVIYLGNYGTVIWAEHLVVNYHPDSAGVKNFQKKPDLWEQIDLATLCPGLFPPPAQQYTLSVNTVGSGSVVSAPTQATYPSGTIVQLTANPNVGWQFADWSGDLTGTANPASITMNGNKIVTATFTQIPYTLTVNVIGAGCSVTKTPNQLTYTYGSSVQLTANEATGWTFAGWSGNLSGTANPATITINENAVVIASFAQNTYTLTLTTIGTGSGSINANSSGPYPYGDTVRLTAMPSEGSSFSGWSGALSGFANPADILMNSSKVVSAIFNQNECTIGVITVGSGSITKTPDQPTYPYGTYVQLTATPGTGWTFSGWSGDMSGTVNPASITMTGDKTVIATFTQNQYAVTLNTVGQGSSTKKPDQVAYTYGSNIDLEAFPATGWHFQSWTSNTSDITISNPSQPITTATVYGAGTITATYAPNNYTLALNVNPVAGGSVTADKQGPYHYGEIVTLTESPAAGYTFMGWSGDGQGSGTTYAITIDGNKTVTANFAQSEYAVAITITPSAGGTVTADKTAPYHYGDIVNLIAYANPGYTFSNWSGAGSGTGMTIQVTVTGDLAVTASFVQYQYELTVNVNGAGCSVAKSANGPYHYGDSVTLTAVPAVGWSFSGWSGDISSTANPAVITVDGNKVVNAVFTQNQYTLEVFIELGNGYVAISPAQSTYTYGSSVQLIGVPDSGYYCRGFSWLDLEGLKTGSVLDPTLNLIINGSLSVYTSFGRIRSGYSLYTFNVGNGTGSISRNASGPYYDGDVVQLTAVPNANSTFSGWGQNIVGTDNPITITMNGNKTVTANFISNGPSPDYPTILHLTPSRIDGPKPDVGETFTMTLYVDNITNLWAWSVGMAWDPNVLQLVTMSEGSFLASAGQTLFFGVNIDGRYLPDMEDLLLVQSSVSGSGDLATLTFKVLSYGETTIAITESTLYGTLTGPMTDPSSHHPKIAHSTTEATVTIMPPPANGPIAKFTMSSSGVGYVGDLVTLDASHALPGYDTWPLGHETTNQITEYTWFVDIGNDGTVDMVLHGENTSVVIPQAGITKITLEVTAPDAYLPASLNYVQTTSVVQLLQVVERPTGANLDVYTERGGQFNNESSDAYGPQELVLIHALVTYNDAPVVGKDVVFEILNKNGNSVDSRVARTDEDGIATIEFRLPWPDVNPENLFGNWTIDANVDVSQQTVSDACAFQFGYIINIESIATFNMDGSPSSVFARGNDIVINVTLTNIRRIFVETAVTFTLYDVSHVPVGVFAIGLSIPAQSVTWTTATIRIPTWTFVGLATCNGNAFTRQPSNNGVAYCPEKIANFSITV